MSTSDPTLENTTNTQPPVEDASALNAAKESRDALSALDHQDLFANFDPDGEEDIEDDYNDPMVENLEDAELLGGRGGRSNLFGMNADAAFGRATSPRLYAQAAQFPTVAQLRIWKIENGIPCGLGSIGAGATEEDLVNHFYHAMPKKREGRCQFKLRPIDINGSELGKEVTLFISEYHAAIQKRQAMDEAEQEEESYGGGRSRRSSMFEESHSGSLNSMSDMMDRMMRSNDSRQTQLSDALEDERERIRNIRDEIANERVDLASNAARGVQQLTERMMGDESRRAERAQKSQAEHSQMLLTTLTSIFSQQQTMMHSHVESQRRGDEYRLEQERQRASRERIEMEERRKRDQLEMEDRRRREQGEYDRKMVAERQYLELRMQREKEEGERRNMRDREERERREKWLMSEQERRESIERAAAKERELERGRRHEMMMAELKAQQTKDREHAERMMVLSKQEMTNKAMGGIGELLPKAAGLLKNMGMEPTDIVQRIFAPPQEEGSVWAETLPKLLGAGADVARAVVASKTGHMPMVAPPQAMESGDAQYPMITDDLYQRAKGVPQFEDQEFFEDELPEKYQSAPIVTPPPMEGDVISFKSTKLYNDEPEQGPITPTQYATQAGLDLATQKTARIGIRNLVQQLATHSDDKWVGLITQALTQEVNIYHYIKAVTVKTALLETGANMPLAQRIMATMKVSGLVPTDLSYGD